MNSRCNWITGLAAGGSETWWSTAWRNSHRAPPISGIQLGQDSPQPEAALQQDAGIMSSAWPLGDHVKNTVTPIKTHQSADAVFFIFSWHTRLTWNITFMCCCINLASSPESLCFLVSQVDRGCAWIVDHGCTYCRGPAWRSLLLLVCTSHVLFI